MPPKLKRARSDNAVGAAAVDSSTDAPPAKHAKAGHYADAAANAHVPSVGASASLSCHGASHSPAAQAAASVLPSDAGEVLKNFQRRCKQTKVSAELSGPLQAQQPVTERFQSATKLLLEDKARDDGPLIDLSHRVEGKGSLLMLLIEVLDAMERLEEEKAAVQAARKQLDDAWEAFFSVLPHVCALIRSSYNTTIKRPDGQDALALLVASAIPANTDDWAYRLTEALLDRGADVNTRFN